MHDYLSSQFGGKGWGAGAKKRHALPGVGWVVPYGVSAADSDGKPKKTPKPQQGS